MPRGPIRRGAGGGRGGTGTLGEHLLHQIHVSLAVLKDAAALGRVTEGTPLPALTGRLAAVFVVPWSPHRRFSAAHAHLPST